MNLSLQQVLPTQRHIIENLFGYYIYEMSGFLQLNPNSDGQYSFNPESLSAYWQLPNSSYIPYFIYVDQNIAGFALVRRYPQCQALWDMEQFFVLRKYASQGVGHKAFAQVCAQHQGQWQIRVLKENVKALHFWKSAVSQLCAGVYSHTFDIDIDLEMHFLRFEYNLLQHS